MFFPSLNQHLIICVYLFKLISQVSDVAHGPLVVYWDKSVESFSCSNPVDKVNVW